MVDSTLKPHPPNFEKLCIFKDSKFILSSFFDISTQKSAILVKPISSFKSRLQHGKINQKIPTWCLILSHGIVFP